MCLYLKDNRLTPEKASKDITCYKVLEKLNGMLFTPYRNMLVQCEKITEEYFQYTPTDRHIDVGIHSFSQESKAIMRCKELNNCIISRRYLVKKCIIPAGTPYWVGNNNELCSKELILKETIYPEL